MDIFQMIATERRAVADLLDGLSESQLTTQSLCHAWNVKEVAAHLTQLWNVPMPKVMVAMAKSRGDFDKAFQSLCVGLADRSASEIAADLRSNAELQKTPPGLGPEAPLIDLVVHRQEMAVPLGIKEISDPAHAVACLDAAVHKKMKSLHPKGGVAGLQFTATDADWTSGAGPEVTGGAVDLLCAVLNRPHVLDDLEGDGADEFRRRFS